MSSARFSSNFGNLPFVLSIVTELYTLIERYTSVAAFFSVLMTWLQACRKIVLKRLLLEAYLNIFFPNSMLQFTLRGWGRIEVIHANRWRQHETPLVKLARRSEVEPRRF